MLQNAIKPYPDVRRRNAYIIRLRDTYNLNTVQRVLHVATTVIRWLLEMI